MLAPTSASTAVIARVPACSVQIILLTYKPNVLAEEIFGAAGELALCRPGLQVVVAWGGGAGAAETAWAERIARWRERGADTVLVSHPQPLQRTRMALATRKDWVLPLADDDPIAVNYLRVMVDAATQAASDVCAVLPSNYVLNFDARSVASRSSGWPQTQPHGRLASMLAEPGCQGAVFWAAYRHAVFSRWLDFGQSLPFQPAYLDQFLPHLAACHGRLVVAAEDTVLLKDDRNWQSLAAIAANNARYYPHAAMALYHEWFWAADLWRLIGAAADVADAQALLLPMRQWCRQMIGHLVEAFDARRQLLGVTMNDAHAQVLEHLRMACGWAFEDGVASEVAAGLQVLCESAEALRSAWLDDGSWQVVTAQTLEAAA